MAMAEDSDAEEDPAEFRDSVLTQLQVEMQRRQRNPYVFMDVSIGERLAGRLVFELRQDVVPHTAENCRCLCNGEKGNDQRGQRLHNAACSFRHVCRIMPSSAASC